MRDTSSGCARSPSTSSTCKRVTLVGQDWGGLIGLRLAAEQPERFARIVVANTGLPTGDFPMPDIWWEFRKAIQGMPELEIGRFVQAGCARPMADGVRAGYDAPFPDDSYCAGPRAMPGLVPTSPDDPATGANRSAWQVLRESATPMLVAFSDGDPITGAMGPIFRNEMRGAQGIDHPVIHGAGHFLQEDAGDELADGDRPVPGVDRRMSRRPAPQRSGRRAWCENVQR